MADDDEVARDEWGLRLAFDSDDPEFVRGFNAGTIYGWLERAREGREARPGVLLPPYAARGENAEMVLRIAEALGMRVISKGEAGDHLEVAFQIPREGT